jgi:GT2 family glycosyltransferase/pimeloyl-ACP methyl ester carboxylesterase
MNAMTPVAIGSCFGWLHHAGGDRGVVMCAAMGYEGLCAHQSWRVLADRLAAAGLPTLRFDYPGEGDSLDADDPALLELWRDSIRAAVRYMRETLGLREVALVGLRLGASLSAEVGGVDRLVQIAPVVKGGAYLRELKIMSRMLAARGPTPEPQAGAEDEIDLEGFVVGRDLHAAIKRIDLTRLSVAPAPKILVMLDPAARLVADYAASLEALGAAVETRLFADYRALTPAPLPPPAPLADLDAVVAWASEGVAPAPFAAPPAGSLATEAFVEQALRFGPGERLAGVLCEPRGAAAETAVLLLNTGANHHIGCGRSGVDYARWLAKRGVASLRMDCLGIGDSEPVPGGPRSVLYRTERRADVSAALDLLAARGLGNVTLMGVCAGAALAVYAAQEDPRVTSLMLPNIQVFDRLDESEIETVLESSFGATSTYVAKAVSAKAWARVASGEVAVGKVAAIAAALLRRKAEAARLFLSGLLGGGDGKTRAAQAAFAALAARGVRILMVHGDHDAGREQLNVRFGAGGRFLRRLPGVSLEVVEGVDHVLASSFSRDAIFERLTSFLEETGQDAKRERRGSPFGAVTTAARRSRPSDRPRANMSQSSSSPVPQAVVCLPTFRRPEMLAATLASIEAQKTLVPFAVVVIDNDASARQGAAVASEILGRGRLDGVVAVEERQGNVHAINAAFRLARETYPAAEFFLMIDDDEVAEPLWLDEMVGAARREKVDIVGGPVLPSFPPGTAAAFRDHPVFWPAFAESGPVPIIYGTGNCLVSRRVFEALTLPALDVKFNFLGGGDTEFFTRCRRAGFAFYWRQEARIHEQVTPNRLAAAWVFRRSLATGAINYRIDRLAARSVFDHLRLLAKNIVLAPVSLKRAAQMLAKAKHPLAATHPIGVAVGRWLAFFGLHPEPYRHPSS